MADAGKFHPQSTELENAKQYLFGRDGQTKFVSMTGDIDGVQTVLKLVEKVKSAS